MRRRFAAHRILGDMNFQLFADDLGFICALAAKHVQRQNVSLPLAER